MSTQDSRVNADPMDDDNTLLVPPSGRRSFLKTMSAGGAAMGALAAVPAARAATPGAASSDAGTGGKRKSYKDREPGAVTYESIDRIALITINRPASNNRLNLVALELLHDAWVRYNKSDDLCAVITGKGNDAFSGGGEPDDLAPDDIAVELNQFARGVPGFAVKLEKPLIGAAAGTVLGGGFTLAMMTDILIAAENTVFTYPEAHASVAGGQIGSLAVRIPHKVAMQVMLLGQPLSVKRAYEVGFVNEIVPVGKQVEVAMKYARQVAENGPLVVSWFKSLVDQTLPKGPAEISAALRAQLQTVLDSNDLAESMNAIKGGRKPTYTGS